MLVVLISASISISCTDTTIAHDIYVTVYPVQYVTESILSGTPLTVGIVPGVTSHSSSVDWSPKEIIAMTKASYLFYVGANYDQYIDLQINSIFANKTVELVKIEEQTSYIQFILGVVHEHTDESNPETTTEESDTSPLGYDPHFWISPLKIQQISALIYDKLATKYTEYHTLMLANYQALVGDLQALSDEFLDVIEVSSKPMLTSTNIYGYLKSDYGLEYISISPGYHEETEQFTTQEKEEIVNEAALHDIQHVIYEKNITSPLSNSVFTALQEYYGVAPTKLEYNVLQALSDIDKSDGKDYISEMYVNLEVIKEATDYYLGQE